MTHFNSKLALLTRLATLGVATGVTTLATTTAHAAPPVKGLTLGLERTFGFVTSHRSFEVGPADVTTSSTGFSLGLAGFNMSTGGNANLLPIYNRPRLAIDYVLDNGISFGGAIGFATATFAVESEAGNTSTTINSPDVTMFLIAPRGGYLIGITEHFGIWPRAGFTYVGLSVDDDDDEEDDDEGASAFALSVDVPLVYTIGPMGAFLAPSVDLGVGGSIDTGPDEPDATVFEFGVQFGFFGVW